MRLVGSAIPGWAQNIPPKSVYMFMASGEPLQYRTSRFVPSKRVIGGIDVYRYSPDDPVELNKDWYAVTEESHHSKVLFVIGPFKDTRHWLNKAELPKWFKTAKVAGEE